MNAEQIAAHVARMFEFERASKAEWFVYEAAKTAAKMALSVGGGDRAGKLRLKMFQMRDAREVMSAAGFTLTTEAKARLYDIQQDIIRAAIAEDDSAQASP